LQAWVDGGKQAGRITANQARSAMGTTRMGQRAGKSVFNSQEALEYAQQVAAALGDRAPSPLKKAIEDTMDVGVVSESAPLSVETHQQLMNELDLWEQQYESDQKETLEEQLQKISRRWGFDK
jgi:DNA-directed RNA polymerase subunit F